MSYKITATRRRPQLFATLVGQEFIASALTNCITKGNIAHVYLFCGPRGVGKTSSARILARSLNCDRGPTPDPCGSCTSCTSIAKGNSIDVIEIDGASNTGVSDVRKIKEELLFQPNISRYKIYIIDEVHMLSVNAFNALLKTIEEPPSHVIFIFATTEVQKVPATVRSRCQRYDFRLIDIETLKNSIDLAAKEMGVEAEPEALFWIAKESGGSLRDAYTLLDQAISFVDGKITFEEIKQRMGLVGLNDLHILMHALEHEKIADALSSLESIVKRGVSNEQILISLGEYLRTLLLIKSGVTNETVLGYGSQSFSKSFIQAYTLDQIQEALSWILELYREIRYSLNPRFEIELFLAKLAQLKYWISPSALLEEVKTLRSKIAHGEPCTQIQEQFPLPSKNTQPSQNKVLKNSEFQEKIQTKNQNTTPKNYNVQIMNADQDTSTTPNDKNFSDVYNISSSYNHHDTSEISQSHIKEDKIAFLTNYFNGKEENL